MERTALLLGAVAAAAALTVYAAQPAAAQEPPMELVAYEGGDVIRIVDAKCTNEAVLNRIDPDAREHFRTATAIVQGQPFKACWGMLPTAVYLIYEDGDQGVIPLAELRVPMQT